MILVEDRQMIAERIIQAQRKGARLKAACELAGIDVRTLQRWKREGLQRGDQRPHAMRRTPAHALSAPGFPRSPKIYWLAATTRPRSKVSWGTTIFALLKEYGRELSEILL